jgi:AbrB family looped-hinge helix DNA binding protein
MKVTEKGQVTIPIQVREKLGIRPGDEVEFTIEHGSARLVRSSNQTTRGRRIVDRLAQATSRGMSTEEIMALTRGE